MYLTKVALLRFAELVETKMAVYKAANQVASEIEAFDDYCKENNISVSEKKLKTVHLKRCKYK